MTICSCAEEETPVVNGASFNMQSFDDFLWKKDAVDTVKFSIDTDFVECDDVRRPIVLALCDSDGQVIPGDKAELFVNGVKSTDNKVEIPVVNGKQTTNLGVVVNESLLKDDVTFNWHIMLCDDAGLSKIFSEHSGGVKSQLLEDDKWIYGLDVQIKNEHVANTVKVWTNIIIIVVVIALVVWIALAHLVIWTSTKFSNVLIDYHDGMGQRRIRMGGCYQLVFSSQRKSDSLFTKIFKGSCKYEQHPFWTHDVIIKSGALKTSLRVMNIRPFYINGNAVRQQEFEIVNENGDKVTITTT